MAKIVLPIRGGPPPEPPYGGLGEEGWARGVTFYELVERAGDGRPTLESVFASCVVPPGMAASITNHRHKVRVLGLADASDTSSCALIACAERFFTLSPRIWMRIFDPAACTDLMHRYAPANEPIPVFVFFGEDQREFTRWRPLADPPEGAPNLRPFTSPEARTWVLQSLHEIIEAQDASSP